MAQDITHRLTITGSGFGLRHSFVIRHSSFVICALSWSTLVLLLSPVGLLNAAVPTEAPTRPISLEFQLPASAGKDSDHSLVIRGKARQQLLVTAKLDNGELRDYTRAVRYAASPLNVVRIDNHGRVSPLTNGTVTITATSPEGLSATLPVAVERFQKVAPVNFPNQIVPIFTKAGCNAGGCHGKASGQNGFRLSLLGFEPTEDYEHLVKEARGRRLFPASPQNSLLLQKATAALPHGGGKRLDPDSDDYRLIVRWISEGMPYGKPTDPTVARIEVFPRERTMPFDGEQQLIVMAHYTDGSSEDVTRSALYEPNDKEMARTDESGRVQLFRQPGDVAVMVRYQARVAVFRAVVPLGAPVANLPQPKNLIDELVFKKLKSVGMPPSEICDDATFLRRVTIDISGRLPTIDETRRFLAECSGKDRAAVADGESAGSNDGESSSLSPGERAGVRGKLASHLDCRQAAREAFIDRLLASADYADYFANKWSALLRNKRTEARQARSTYAFHAWIRDSLLENKPYNQFVREVLTASGDLEDNPAVVWYQRVREPQAELEDTAQLFLGMRLQCAQCHHHPFEKWSQQDYYSLAAFFTQVSHKNAGAEPGGEMVFARRTMPTATNKKTKQSVKPAGLGSQVLNLSPDDDARQALADWMTGRDNPFFARSLVNRYWKHFFNRGIVEPEDDMRETNPPTNPELLDALARIFIDSGYDLKRLVRTICRSRVYQLSEIPNQYNKIDKQYFSRYYPKRLTAEVLFDAVNQVTGTRSKFDGLPPGTRAVCLPDNSFNASSYFLTVFGRPDSSSACECERSQDASLAQSLHLINAKEIQEKLADDKGIAARLANDSRRSDEEKFRELYLLAYSREPDEKETRLAGDYVAKTTAGKDAKEALTGRRHAYEDIVWALINTKEFLFNH